MVDIVHNLNWGIDNAQLGLQLREGHLKEAIEQLEHHLLALLRRADIGKAQLHAQVKLLELLAGADLALRVKQSKDGRAGIANRVMRGKVTARHQLV